MRQGQSKPHGKSVHDEKLSDPNVRERIKALGIQHMRGL